MERLTGRTDATLKGLVSLRAVGNLMPRIAAALECDRLLEADVVRLREYRSGRTPWTQADVRRIESICAQAEHIQRKRRSRKEGV
jgi:hypothetical protein